MSCGPNDGQRIIMDKLYIAMVGLPARGKSTVSRRLCDGLGSYGLKVRIFNNGDMRRLHLGPSSSLPEFYNNNNQSGREQREQIARMNLYEAKSFLGRGGNVAILDATNSSRERRKLIEENAGDIPILFIECINKDEDMLNASIHRKSTMPEFSHLGTLAAMAYFRERICYYEKIFVGLSEEEHFVRLDTLHNRIEEEKSCSAIPHYLNIRDILVSDWVRHLYLVRHAQSLYNVDGRLGGDSGLTEYGRKQAAALARHFSDIPVPFVFTSTRRRAQESAEAIRAQQDKCLVTSLPEFDEINAGICEDMRYEDIKRELPEEYKARKRDKYNYSYPLGEGYASMADRVYRGLKKALFLSGAASGTMIIGHQAINRMILSNFLYRRAEDVPYISIPQDQYFHIVVTHRKKLIELVRFTGH